MTLEFVVIVRYQRTVNMSMPLALTEINVLGSFISDLKKLERQKIYFLYFLNSESLLVIFQPIVQKDNLVKGRRNQ